MIQKILMSLKAFSMWFKPLMLAMRYIKNLRDFNLYFISKLNLTVFTDW